MKVWLVRAGKWGQDEELALEKGLAVIGWYEMPDMSKADTPEKMYDLCRKVYPGSSEARIRNFVSQLYSFVHRIERGDIVALPRKSNGTIALAKVTGPYQYRENLGEVHHVHPVEWIRTDVPRSEFAQDLLYSLGAFMTVGRIQRNNAEARFARILKGEKDPGLEAQAETIEEVSTGEGATDVADIARSQILSHIEANFKGHELSRLVEAVLKAEGYTTHLSSPGPDGGVDILAGRGALGFESPRLCVQVKSSTSQADVGILRTLQGTMQTFKADQGLLVSWSGFNSVVQREARLSFFAVRLWNANHLVDAVLANYDKFPEELQSQLPLKRIWALVLEE